MLFTILVVHVGEKSVQAQNHPRRKIAAGDLAEQRQNLLNDKNTTFECHPLLQNNTPQQQQQLNQKQLTFTDAGALTVKKNQTQMKSNATHHRIHRNKIPTNLNPTNFN